MSLAADHTPGTDEADLVARSQAGDRPAFAALVERYWTGCTAGSSS